MFGFNKCGCGCGCDKSYDNACGGGCGCNRACGARPEVKCDKEYKKLYEVKEITLVKNKYEIKFEDDFRQIDCRKFVVDDNKCSGSSYGNDNQYDEQRVSCGGYKNDGGCGCGCRG